MKSHILFDDEQKAYPAYLVQYLVLLEGEERRPTCTLDARDARMTMSWDALDSCVDCKAKGTGGNLQIGKIRYGELQKCLDLRRENDTCYLENKYVRIINNNYTMKEVADEDEDDMPVASYNCEEIDDDVNGAYSPLLDALFYGTVVGKMYADWYNITPLGDTMTFRVHFGVNFTNAFWNGYECQYGDGGEMFHPLISIDIVGHEVAHGVTEKSSNLYYFQQWGGINEAFSDMAGETAEAYLDEADWLMGVDVSKHRTPLRFFENPEVDNSSIAHADNFTDFMDPHYSSGVYNRVFYLLVHDYGLPIKNVFRAFLHANQMYWHHMSDFVRAACDVMKAAYDLGQDGGKFRKAFEEVGIEVCDTEDHVLGLRSEKNYTDLTVSKNSSPFFLFGVPGEFAESVTVNASSSQGKVYIVVSNKTWGNEEQEVHVYAEGFRSVQFDVPDNTSLHVSVKLSTDSDTPLTDVTLVASYACVEHYATNTSGDISEYLFYIWEFYCKKGQEEDDEEEELGEEGEDEEENSCKENDDCQDEKDTDKEEDEDRDENNEAEENNVTTENDEKSEADQAEEDEKEDEEEEEVKEALSDTDLV